MLPDGTTVFRVGLFTHGLNTASQGTHNAHVEQRNDSLVRKFLGYDRLEFRELIPLINYYYACIVCPMINHFMPSFKLKGKLRIKSRTRRIYEAPVTPYQRLMDSAFLPEARKIQLSAIHRSLNPVTLAKKERRIRSLINTCLKRLRAGQPMPQKVPSYELWMSLIPNPPRGRSAYAYGYVDTSPADRRTRGH